MVQYMSTRLDTSFAALSDATRRGVLERLGRADASITDLAEKFHMTLTGMKKHVGVLEQAGLVTTEKVGRVRTCRLGPRRLGEETAWLESYRRRRGGRREGGGLSTREKVGRVGTCRLGPGRLEEETAWLESYRRRWCERFDEL